MTASTTAATDLLADLRDAHRTYERAQRRVDERGEDRLRQAADRHDRLQGLFDEYEERATGDGDFAVFIEFQEEMAKFVADLPEDEEAVPHRDAFETVDDLMQQRRLTESDFAAAREALAPVAEEAALLEERDAARRRYRDCRERARRQVRELGERIGELERLRELGAADLDAPVERLRDPVEAYNDAVEAAFADFRREAGAREVLGFVAATGAFPLVPFEQPPARLREYVDEHEAGTEPVPTLLEYADYSVSKLDHYVEDADALTRAVGTSQTYLRRLDADPLTIDWPPPSADALRWRVRELIQVTGRFAPAATHGHLRALRAWTDRDAYTRLRESAVARAQVSDEQRRRLASGAVADELDDCRERKADLEAALSDLPDP